MLDRTQINHIVNEASNAANNLDVGASYYFNYHYKRFIFDLDLLNQIVTAKTANTNNKIKLLDIGAGFQTGIFQKAFPDMQIDTLGFANTRFPPINGGKHIHFDLNDAHYPDKWYQGEGYDIITMFEVIEHLYTSPKQVLQFVSSLLNENGLLILQTPNGIALSHRVEMLLGKHPFPMLNETRDDHFREYTRQELLDIGKSIGLTVEQVYMNHIMSTGSLSSKIYGLMSDLMPQDWRKNITIVFEKK